MNLFGFGTWRHRTSIYDCIADFDDLGIFGFRETPTLFNWLLPWTIHQIQKDIIDCYNY